MVDAAHQWLTSTAGRIATCAHSWMQAVHWVAGSGLYRPARQNGPQFGPTTLLVAQEIAALSVCRPGIDYLMRKLKLSERTIQYHLGMLREAGLLVYRVKGTRASGQPNQASVFERVIPLEFDEALGIRTAGEGVQRRPVGIAEEGRTLIGKLAKKAARKTRRPRRKPPLSRGSRCTPMQGGTSTGSSAGSTYSPPESKLASGEAKSPTQKKSNRGPKKLNKIGRRYQLAKELIQLVPWLKGASVPRIAWIVRDVADAGWTALEVQAIAEQECPIVAAKVRRPSGLLADRLGSLHLLFTTPERRQTAVQAWQDSRIQEQARHASYGELATQGPAPVAVSVQSLMAEAVRRTREIAAGPIDPTVCFEVSVDTAPEPLALEALDRDLVKTIRAEATDNLDVITSSLETGMSERDARRLYTNWLVDQALAARRALAPAY
ncbi:transcriptional regulator [Streptomyces sp. NPDC059916]|uniref:transcriptional regulator n=1 Tax=Streptomyces sp. NPDC059916 TaxID=3347001 RepID=UPI0036D059D9